MDDIFASLYGSAETNEGATIEIIPDVVPGVSPKNSEPKKRKRCVDTQKDPPSKKHESYFIRCNVDLSSSSLKSKVLVTRKKPSPSLEALRHRAVSSIAREFMECMNALGTKWFKHYEAWLWACRDLNTVEPMIIPTTDDLACSVPLISKLVKTGMLSEEATKLCSRMLKCCAKERRNLKRLLSTVQHNNRVKHSTLALLNDHNKIVLKNSGVKVEINEFHYAKLRGLMQEHAGSDAIISEQEFDAAVFCLLTRYDSLQGCHHKNGGNQAAIHHECFQVMNEEFDVQMECFASPLNCHYSRFCSAFLDTDAVFGSLGSFFHFNPSEGSFEANPPFDPKLVGAMTRHMETLLSNSTSPLSFIVIIPYWPLKDAWKNLLGSSFNRKHIQIAAKDHGYFEGGQHLRFNQYRIANADSSVFFLQNAAGFLKWEPTKCKTNKLLKAFLPKTKENIEIEATEKESESKTKKKKKIRVKKRQKTTTM